MYTAMRRSLDKRNRDDKGFTLIELLVVIIIVGILAAIAIPIFLNQRKKAVDASMKSDVRTIATQMETAFTDLQAYPKTGITFTAGGLNLGIGGETVRMSPNNVPLVHVNTAGDAFCVAVTNTKSSRTAGFRWESSLGGLQTTDALCDTTTYGANLVPAATP